MDDMFAQGRGETEAWGILGSVGFWGGQFGDCGASFKGLKDDRRPQDDPESRAVRHRFQVQLGCFRAVRDRVRVYPYIRWVYRTLQRISTIFCNSLTNKCQSRKSQWRDPDR